MSLILRYVDLTSSFVVIEESFLRFINVNDTTGLNLMSCDMTNTCSKARDFFGVIQRIYTIFAYSTKRWHILKDNSHVDSVRAIRFQIVDTRDTLLQVFENDNDSKIKSEAKSLAKNELGDFKFLVTIVIWYDMLNYVNSVRVKYKEKNILMKTHMMIHWRFEKYEDYEKTFGFLFTSTKLNSLDDVCLKSYCDAIEFAFKNGDCNDVDANELCVELKLLMDLLPKKDMRAIHILQFLKHMNCFSNTIIAYRKLLTIPERLNGLTLLAIENDHFEKVAYEDVIEDFVSKNLRRLLLFK
uniref:Uncharacterized protein n=1 Tax=Kalanchoe fedtschenkoi TaxID=63787 RepID=A0A7N0UM60_KALFE